MTPARAAWLISRLPLSSTRRSKAGVDPVVECSEPQRCAWSCWWWVAFPLRGLHARRRLPAVVAGHRTSSGLLFGLPIVLDEDERASQCCGTGCCSLTGARTGCDDGRKARLGARHRWREAPVAYGTTSD